MVPAMVLFLLAAIKLFFPEQAKLWHDELRQLLSDTADAQAFVEAVGRSLRKQNRGEEHIEVFYPAADGIEDRTAVPPSYPPL
jgi:hypothetical protein